MLRDPIEVLLGWLILFGGKNGSTQDRQAEEHRDESHWSALSRGGVLRRSRSLSAESLAIVVSGVFWTIRAPHRTQRKMVWVVSASIQRWRFQSQGWRPGSMCVASGKDRGSEVVGRRSRRTGPSLLSFGVHVLVVEDAVGSDVLVAVALEVFDGDLQFAAVLAQFSDLLFKFVEALVVHGSALAECVGGIVRLLSGRAARIH